MDNWWIGLQENCLQNRIFCYAGKVLESYHFGFCIFWRHSKIFKKDEPTNEQPVSEEIVEHKGEADEENS